MEQLTLDFPNSFEVGDKVKVSAVPHESQPVESFYYIQDHTGKKGVIVRAIEGKVTCFEVGYSNGNHGMFYEHEIMKIKGGHY